MNSMYWARPAVEGGWYGGRAMTGKKDDDATKNLPEGEPTQTLAGGTKVGLPKREDVMAALRKVARKPPK
jgi:hypothetical protein